MAGKAATWLATSTLLAGAFLAITLVPQASANCGIGCCPNSPTCAYVRASVGWGCKVAGGEGRVLVKVGFSAKATVGAGSWHLLAKGTARPAPEGGAGETVTHADQDETLLGDHVAEAAYNSPWQDKPSGTLIKAVSEASVNYYVIPDPSANPPHWRAKADQAVNCWEGSEFGYQREVSTGSECAPLSTVAPVSSNAGILYFSNAGDAAGNHFFFDNGGVFYAWQDDVLFSNFWPYTTATLPGDAVPTGSVSYALSADSCMVVFLPKA